MFLSLFFPFFTLRSSQAQILRSVISRTVSLERSKVKTLNFARVNIQLFKELVNKIHWETVLKDRGDDQCWQLLKAPFLRVQKCSSSV